MAHIEKRTGKDGTISYRVKIRSKGQPAISATFGRLSDARAYARQVEAQIAAGRYFPQHEARRHTLSDAVERYITQRRPGVQRCQQLRWWADRIGYLRLMDVSSAAIVEERDALAAVRKSGTVNRYMGALSHCLTLCIREWGWLQEHPMRNISRLREPRGRVRFLEADELERLLAACKASTHQYLYPIVMLALCTGCRKQEIVRLQWSQVAKDYRSVTLTETKNDDPRRVPIVEPALSVLHEHGRTRRILGCDWVFPGRGMNRPCNPDKAWQVAVKQAGLADFRFHDLRHTTGSYLAMSGATLRDIAEILGHRDIRQTMRYTHLLESSVADTLDKAMGKFLG